MLYLFYRGEAPIPCSHIGAGTEATTALIKKRPREGRKRDKPSTTFLPSFEYHGGICASLHIEIAQKKGVPMLRDHG